MQPPCNMQNKRFHYWRIRKWCSLLDLSGEAVEEADIIYWLRRVNRVYFRNWEGIRFKLDILAIGRPWMVVGCVSHCGCYRLLYPSAKGVWIFGIIKDTHRRRILHSKNNNHENVKKCCPKELIIENDVCLVFWPSFDTNQWTETVGRESMLKGPPLYLEWGTGLNHMPVWSGQICEVWYWLKTSNITIISMTNTLHISGHLRYFGYLGPLCKDSNTVTSKLTFSLKCTLVMLHQDCEKHCRRCLCKPVVDFCDFLSKHHPREHIFMAINAKLIAVVTPYCAKNKFISLVWQVQLLDASSCVCMGVNIQWWLLARSSRDPSSTFKAF